VTPAPWSHTVGDIPYKVTVFENPARKDVLYLQWRADGNWRYQSLRKGLRSADGKIIKARQREAVAACEAKHLTLIRGLPAAERPKPALTLGETLPLLMAPHRGLYPVDTPHRREVLRSWAVIVAVLGEETPWTALKPSHVREVWRRKLDAVRSKGAAGRRSAQIVVRDLRAVAQKLVDEDRIPPEVIVSLKAKGKALEEIATATPDAKVARPRHTLEESRQILAVAWGVDPRFGLLMYLGAELRLGQVRRARRSDLDHAAGRFTSPGTGKKRGEVVYLTDGQRAAVERAMNGYLREVEGRHPDYPLFPAGQLKGGRSGEGVLRDSHVEARPVNTTTLRRWFQEAERLAGVPHVKGRGYYGLRRAAVDGAKAEGISREGLQKIGGWTDSQMPDAIYADQEATYAREEAARVRAKIRGESE